MTKHGLANRSFAVAPARLNASPAGPAADGDGHERAGSPDPAFSLAPLRDRTALGQSWCRLQERCSPSLFQSWGWIEAWLGILPPAIEPYVLVAQRDALVCALGIICRARRRRHGWLPSAGLFLNETGVPDLDALTVEYNGLLCSDADRASLTTAAMSFLADAVEGWDELYLSGVGDDSVAAAQSSGLGVTITGRHPCHFVDLGEIRDRKKSYLDCLSRNTRSQVRRALRRYEERGALSAVPAATADQALSFFGEMKALHQAYWKRRGEPGAFAIPVFEKFHRAFIASRFPAGEIEMLRVAVDGAPIGYLYNIVHRKHVYSYQSGFAYEQDGAMKPGLVSHYLAIERSLSEGAEIYDFMAGGGQHKRSLGTVCRDMVWLRAAKPRLRFRAEAFLRTLKQRLSRSAAA